ncbi:DEKNAAC105180 [Brettanomyces naardenensis]|uniref:DEKNAAC105180 n=1 Tax=Brettanomyces naardenensis TaxID=13370 RepID=A0A448YT05_BRENA|nr:DEKNAAC105180 [Brettanomyces naardenensis]
MNFGEYDDFTQDNNPFAGSNHDFSQGILNGQVSGSGNTSSNGPLSSSSLAQSISNEQLLTDTSTVTGNDHHTAPPSLPSANISYTSRRHSASGTSGAFSDSSFVIPTDASIVGYEILRDIKNFRTVFYRIELSGGNSIFRRYSDFVSLRSYLVKFFQTKVIPPVPEKHSIGRLLRHPFDYKSDTQIIDRRIRLLNYFIGRLLDDEQVRRSEFLGKFLDPREKYWSKILKGPPFTTLSSKSIFLTSPRDPTAPSPYFAYVPPPPRGMLRNYTSELNDTVFKPLEVRARTLLKQVRKMESTANRLIRDFQENREGLIELGGFFNIFSIIEDQHDLIESFGNKIDLNFLNIEVLTNSLTIQLKEKLMVIRLTLLSVLQLLHFRKLKELQLSYLQDLILRRQSRLKGITERVLAEGRLDQVIRSGEVQSPSLSRAIATLKLRRNAVERLDRAASVAVNDTDDSASFDDGQSSMAESWNRAISASEDPDTTNDVNYSSSSRNKAIERLSVSELQSELVRLGRELNRKLIPCFDRLTDDVEYISVNVESNVNEEMRQMVSTLQRIMRDWKNEVFGEYLRSCTEVWQHD